MNNPNLSKKLSAFLLISIILLTTNLVIHCQSQTSDSPKSIVLFSWDGVERTVFLELLNAGKLPFVTSLSIINHTCLIGETPQPALKKETTTRPQHAVMLSGYLPHTTGIYSNNPEVNPSGLSLPRGYSLFERVREWFDKIQKSGNRFRIAGGSGKPKNVADMLGFPENEMGYHYNEKGFDVFYYAWRRISGYPPDMPAHSPNMTTVFLEIATNEPPFLYFFHFNEPDHVGHNYGVNSTQYRDSIIKCDQATMQICKKLEPSSPAIIITSDHGFGQPTAISHLGAPETFLATNLPITATQSYMPDIAVTTYAYLGIDYTQFEPTIEGESLIRARTSWHQFFYWNGIDPSDGAKFYLEPQRERWKIRWNYIPKSNYSYHLTFYVYMRARTRESAGSYYLYETVTTEGNLMGQHAFLEPPRRQYMVELDLENIEYLELWLEEDLSSIPEFPSPLILLLFIIIIILAAVYLGKRL